MADEKNSTASTNVMKMTVSKADVSIFFFFSIKTDRAIPVNKPVKMTNNPSIVIIQNWASLSSILRIIYLEADDLSSAQTEYKIAKTGTRKVLALNPNETLYDPCGSR